MVVWVALLLLARFSVATDKCASLCNHEERIGLLEFAISQTESTQALLKENNDLKNELEAPKIYFL